MHPLVVIGPASADPLALVLMDIAIERGRQDAKWGAVQPGVLDGTGPDVEFLNSPMSMLASYAKGWCDLHAGPGQTWSNIILEEVFEALEQSDPAKLREELVQVAAVAAKWVEAIDRRSA